MRLNSPNAPVPGWWSLGLALTAALWGVLARLTSETWWWVATLDLLPPQVLLPLLLWLIWYTRRSAWLLSNLLFAALFVLFQVGLILHFGAAGGRSAATLTVLTLNAKYASAPPGRLAEVVAREGAEVVALQEAQDQQGQGTAYENNLRAAFPGWTLVRRGELLLLTRLPLQQTGPVPFWKGQHELLAVRVRWQGQNLTVLNAHLPTLALRPTQGEPDTLIRRVQQRLAERRALPEAVAGVLTAEPGPLLLVGDINAPTRGQMHALLRQVGLQDGFAAAGQGFGFTYHQRFGFARLDYVWQRGLNVERAQVLSDALSDHRPLVVRLTLE